MAISYKSYIKVIKEKNTQHKQKQIPILVNLAEQDFTILAGTLQPLQS